MKYTRVKFKEIGLREGFPIKHLFDLDIEYDNFITLQRNKYVFRLPSDTGDNESGFHSSSNIMSVNKNGQVPVISHYFKKGPEYGDEEEKYRLTDRKLKINYFYQNSEHQFEFTYPTLAGPSQLLVDYQLIFIGEHLIMLKDTKTSDLHRRLWGEGEKRVADIRIVDIKTQREVCYLNDVLILIFRFGSIPDHYQSISPNGKYLVCWEDSTTIVFDIEKEKTLYKKDGLIFGNIRWSPSGRYALFEDRYGIDKISQVVRVNTGQVITTIYGEECWFVDISEGGDNDILAQHDSKTITFISLQTGKTVGSMDFTEKLSLRSPQEKELLPLIFWEGTTSEKYTFIHIPGISRYLPSADRSSILLMDGAHFWVISPVKKWR
jgi:hypothetical protein